VIAPFVSVDWLTEHAGDVVLADVRWYLDGRSGADAFVAGHLPSARFVDLETWLSGPGGPEVGRHPLPDPEVFAEGMRRLGVDDADTVIAYDDAGGVIAARLVWMLRVTGHDAAVLDGGLAAFAGGLEPGAGAPPSVPGRFTSRPWPVHRLAELADLRDLAWPGGPERTTSVLVDARDADRYRGDHEPVDPRAGHIPGARSLPCRANLGPDGRLVPPGELRRRFERLGVRHGSEVISYCGSGVTACHNLLALEHAGYAPGRLFPGSWSQYSRTGLPAATGDDATGFPATQPVRPGS
jgi:thiosulfate/3-mercaptopyruvate sulfurtransferase